MKANVMFYHTSDTSEKVLDECATLTEARRLLAQYVAQTSKTVLPSRIKKDGDRVEFRFTSYAFAYYIEPVK